MRVHLPLALVSLLLVGVASDGEGAPPGPDIDDGRRIDVLSAARVPVQVFTAATADFGANDQSVALAVARDALSTASVDVVWTICGPGACLTPAPETLKIRVVRSPDGGKRDPHRLGHAWVDPRAGTGVLATVFIDRTRRLAAELDIDHRVLLGRAIAHELGHLLLATATHGSTGLMRERWSRDELLRARRHDWVFDPLDAAAIRKRLARSRDERPGAS